MKRAAWAIGLFLISALLGNLLLWFDVPIVRAVFDWCWRNVAPVLDRLTGLR